MRYPLVKINNNLTPRHQRVNQLFTNIDFAYLAEQDNWTPDLLESYQILIEFVASATARQEHRDYMRTGLGRDLMLRELLRRVPRFDPSPPSRPSYPVAIEDEGQDPLGSAQLPPELLMIVYGMLSGADLVACMQVSREWHKVASDISVPYNQTSKNLQTAWDNLFVWPGNFVDDSASGTSSIPSFLSSSTSSFVKYRGKNRHILSDLYIRACNWTRPCVYYQKAEDYSAGISVGYLYLKDQHLPLLSRSSHTSSPNKP